MLTTAEAAALLAERGYTVKPDTVKHWCEDGKFPGATCPGGRVWQIPREEVEAFEPPTRGRPRAQRREDDER